MALIDKIYFKYFQRTEMFYKKDLNLNENFEPSISKFDFYF